MENLIVVMAGLVILIPWITINHRSPLTLCTVSNQQSTNKLDHAWRIMAYSTNGVYGGSRSNDFPTNSIQPHYPSPDNLKEGQKELDNLDENELIEEKVKSEKRLKEITKKILAKEKLRLQKRLNEIDKEINAK